MTNSNDERRLLALFRQVTEFDRRLTLGVLESIVEDSEKKQPVKPKPALRLVKSTRQA